MRSRLERGESPGVHQTARLPTTATCSTASDKIYACYSPGTPSIPRVCGDSLNGCPMNVVGSCDRACRDDGS